ncbi:MAG: hypothetical protein ABSF85_12945 [Terriglobales bacterium]|jgi:hypothetical protein
MDKEHHAKFEAAWVTLGGLPSGQELDGNVQNTAYPHILLKLANLASQPLSRLTRWLSVHFCECFPVAAGLT